MKVRRVKAKVKVRVMTQRDTRFPDTQVNATNVPNPIIFSNASLEDLIDMTLAETKKLSLVSQKALVTA